MARHTMSETLRLTGIKQGAGKSVRVAFGSKNGGARKVRKQLKRKPNRRVLGKYQLACWDAFNPSHLALPRAVAPYVVIRTTKIYEPATTDRRILNLFGPCIRTTYDAGQWTSSFVLSTNKMMTDNLGVDDGVYRGAFDAMAAGSWSAASITPAAFSVQIMNPQALQSTSGMVYIGRCKNKVNLAEDTTPLRTFQDVADDLISYSNPRLCAAGKLALRGVQVDAVPNNMSELAKFTTGDFKTSGPETLGQSTTRHFEGFNPIFVYNPDAIPLQYLVCCEWRVRFDPSNPAYAACVSHKPTTDTRWWEHMEHAVRLGNGVIDIVERVAATGLVGAALSG